MVTDTLRRLWGRRISPRAFSVWALATVVGLIVIVPSGGLVRLTKSGLGCPDWPACNGEVIPEFDSHAAIEYSNRILSFVIMLVAVATWLLSLRLSPRSRGLSRWSAGAAAATVGQVPLGGLTVLFDLHPILVGSHFILSFVALGLAIVALILSREYRRVTPRRTDPLRRRLGVGLIVLLGAVVVTGVLVTAAGPHSGDEDVTKRFWDLGLAIAIHVRVVIVFVVAAVGVWLWSWKTGPADRTLQKLAILFVPLLALQVAIGEYQYRNGMPWEVILGHVTVAALVFSTGTAAAWHLAHPPYASADSQRRQAASTAPE